MVYPRLGGGEANAGRLKRVRLWSMSRIVDIIDLVLIATFSNDYAKGGS
jgi:hypothetical protein